MQSIDRVGVFEPLAHSIQLLAAQPDNQLRLLPHVVGRADEIGLEFTHGREVVIKNFGPDLSADRVAGLESIDRVCGRN